MNALLYFEWFFELFTLLFLERPIPLEICALSDAGQRAEVLYHHPAFRDEKTIPWSLPEEAPEVLGEKFDKVIAEWHGKSEHVKRAMGFHTAAVYNLGLSFWRNLEYSFFLLAQAVECYHGELSSKDEQCKPTEDRSEFQEIDRVLESSPLSPAAKHFWEERKDRLIQKSLALKLEDVYKRWQESMDILEFLKDPQSRKKFFAKVRDLRGPLPTEEKDLEKQSSEGPITASESSLSSASLGKLDFPPEECQEIIRQVWYFCLSRGPLPDGK